MKSLTLIIVLLGCSLIGLAEYGLSSSTSYCSGTPLDYKSALGNQVLVFDYQGGLIKTFAVADVANDDITVADHMLLIASDFAFDHNGDYYYFNDRALDERLIN